MNGIDRREFLENLGRGSLLALLAPACFGERPLGIRTRPLQDPDDRLDLGRFEPLVREMQDTPPDLCVRRAVERLRAGTPLDTLVAAAALANARTFGGEDYTGYHCAMALIPARQMAAQMPDPKLAALPVLKVLQRNATRMRERGGREKEVLRKVGAPTGSDAAAMLAAERAGDIGAAERSLAGIISNGAGAAFDALQPLVRDNVDVHQVVLAWRAWDMISLVGAENAQVMLRQSLRQCVDRERSRAKDGRPAPTIRDVVPKLMTEFHLDGDVRPSAKPADDATLDALAARIMAGTSDAAAREVADALSKGLGLATVGEAISLAAVRLLLHDPGTTRENPGKPKGSVHGASVGVHASDAASAWRRIAAVTTPATSTATMIAAGWHTGGQSGSVDLGKPHHASARDRAAAVVPKDVVGALEESIRGRDQAAAAALVERYGSLDLPADPVIATCLTHAVESDGALHHEKFFRTAIEEFSSSRPAFRWLYLAALARVVASGFGFEAPGLSEARQRLLA